MLPPTSSARPRPPPSCRRPWPPRSRASPRRPRRRPPPPATAARAGAGAAAGSTRGTRRGTAGGLSSSPFRALLLLPLGREGRCLRTRTRWERPLATGRAEEESGERERKSEIHALLPPFFFLPLASSSCLSLLLRLLLLLSFFLLHSIRCSFSLQRGREIGAITKERKTKKPFFYLTVHLFSFFFFFFDNNNPKNTRALERQRGRQREIENLSQPEREREIGGVSIAKTKREC